MDKGSAKKRIEKLKKVINYHRYLYHVLDKQEISDPAFDSLKNELVVLEKQYPDMVTKDSPSQRVGGKPLDKFEKIEHQFPMLSIDDIFDKEALELWEKYLKRLQPLEKFEYFCEPKIDGFAITLIYDKGILIAGATRGDGRIGEDVTQNIRTINSIPLRLEIHRPIENKNIEHSLKEKIKNGRIEIRGEVYMDKASFDKINKQRAKNKESIYANPRNLAAGSIRQLDPKLAASRRLKFLAYDIASDISPDTSTDMDIAAHSQEHDILTCLGFRAEKGKICKNLNEAVNFWEETQKNRDILPFQVDGVVILVNNNQIFHKLGVAGKSPRAIRAFKFLAKQATTKIIDINVQVGRTGAITPVAILEPVKIGGATITRATLHNEDELERLGVKIGDTVIIERAGDVIPAVSMVLKDLRDGKEKTFNFPHKCPVCGKELVRAKSQVIWRCENHNCPARKREFLEHFVSKKAFNIEGLGPKIIEQLNVSGLVSQPADFFELKQGDLMPLERFAEKSADNLVAEIQDKKQLPLNRFIYSLGIRHIGEETALDLAVHFKTLEKLIKVSIAELEFIPNIGERVAESIYNWFNNEDNLLFLDKLLRVGVIISPPPQRENKVLDNKNFVITGTLESISREQAHKRIWELGGSASDTVSKNTDFLVVGSNPGSKLEKAKKFKVKILSEKDFIKIIK
ncbi:NAD-dependent DNA ligase LigA [Patescibacteria group bacterium]|nr:NAD-dependent DNA ligase LigA [Patescibacteria group bacterium]MBU4162246.1 NAD-dependent DNA ligase LigA [Patescibacteria group bacterium]